MNCLKSSAICNSSSKKYINNYICLKSKIRGLWSSYFNLRYLNIFRKPNKGIVYQHSFNQWKNPASPLVFQESKFDDLFEYASKSKLLSASMIDVDIVEVSGSIDNYKEAYPFTVIFFAKF